VYAHCLFCNADLGRNEAIAALPVGRRLAYDAAKGRLWVVCSACARWNLTPLEERWEAIEQAERLYRGTRLRASTDNVGLARVADGVDLVRVGRPLLPEFAAWRYGRQLTERRLRYTLRAAPAAAIGGVGAVVTLGASIYVPALMTPVSALGAPAIIVGGVVAATAMNVVATVIGRMERAARHATLGTAGSVAGRVRTDPDPATPDPATRTRVVVRRGHLAESTIRTREDGELTLDLRHDAGRAELPDAAARRALALLTPALNRAGAGAGVLNEVVRSIAVRGGPEGYLAAMSRWVAKTTRPMSQPPSRWGPDSILPDAGLYALSPAQRLALELVMHDDAERRALDGDLAALETAWRDAEEIAAIADDLVVPRGVQAAWEQLRSRVRS